MLRIDILLSYLHYQIIRATTSRSFLNQSETEFMQREEQVNSNGWVKNDPFLTWDEKKSREEQSWLVCWEQRQQQQLLTKVRPFHVSGLQPKRFSRTSTARRAEEITRKQRAGMLARGSDINLGQTSDSFTRPIYWPFMDLNL